MHDPNTLAFTIKSPLRKRYPNGETYRASLVHIWHRDPERDGTDDSCGWSSPKLTDKQREQLKNMAWWEARDPWFRSWPAKTNDNVVEVESLIRGALVLTARVLRISVTWSEVGLWAAELTHFHCDNLRSTMCLLPGWHTNSTEDTEYWRKDAAESLCYILGRFILRNKRKWWQHPRFHVWHWQIKIMPVLTFKRWAFSRCAKCGGGFNWGESPVSGSWDSTGPLWFSSESNVMHMRCAGHEVKDLA